MTPDEAAKLGVEDVEGVRTWLSTATPQEIVQFHHRSMLPMWRDFARVVLDVRLSEIAEKNTNKLVAYTKVLTWLTVVLALIAIWQIATQIFPALPQTIAHFIQRL